MKVLRYSLIGAVAVWLAITACSPSRTSHAAVKDPAARHKAPEFALKDANGKVVHLSDYKGKVVLLDFWATWCGPCNVEIPWFTQFEKKYRDRGFEVLGVSMDENGWKDIAPFAKRQKINYQIVLGDDRTGDLYGGIQALPTSFIIDREGRIAAVEIGLNEKRDFQDAIENLL
ncbi:MAG TPA: TlpA disulfide reductase family protein [Bryobacteraceae bacterium]|nr:TlpA disulfide reductase family protein [Bryobacteraceae bacterium]